MEIPRDNAIRQYFLTNYQPEWLEAHGFGKMSLRELLNDPEVRQTLGLVKTLLGPLIEAADYHQWERAAAKAEQMAKDGPWVLRYGGESPPEPATFDAFDPSDNPSLVAACEAAKRWAFGVGPGILTLSGPPGVGKTHLARAAWSYLEERGRQPIWCVEGRLVLDLHAAIQKQTVKGITDCLTLCPYVICDDLGVSAQGDWMRGIFDQFVDARWADANRRTLFTTNIGADDLPPRIASRLRDRERAMVLVLDAPDHRLSGHHA